ncbi:hypothetical protein DICVIV_13671 [Dictyocaulus viviparus]|uniref:Uncharacterized protein n=1 Tax=Dictyocaulus viviparus TaxID=29172 RepID=A0A0D8XD80_DICVI|nr:hypothetical protein DICVIV_13671 [Dictyocaulus viviparus]
MVSAANDTNNSINNRNIPSYAKNPSVSSQTTPKLIEDNSTYKFYIIIFSLLLLFVLIALSICIAILVRKVKRRQKFNENGFPNPPWRLETSSQLILLEWVKVIVTKNPLVWRCSDREIIWLYDKRHPACMPYF